MTWWLILIANLRQSEIDINSIPLGRCCRDFQERLIEERKLSQQGTAPFSKWPRYEEVEPGQKSVLPAWYLTYASVLWLLLLSFSDIKLELLWPSSMEWRPEIPQESSRSSAPDWGCKGIQLCELSLLNLQSIYCADSHFLST